MGVCVRGLSLSLKKVLLALVSKIASEESSSNSSCPQIEGTFGFMPITRGGECWDSRSRDGGKVFETFCVALIGSFVKSHHLIHIHTMSIPLVEISGGLELP